MTRWNRFLVGTLITIVLSVVVPVQPQDVVKVSPETHAILLENERVRVLNVHAKPGEKVGMHSHPASTLYYLTDGKLKVTCPMAGPNNVP